MSMNLPKAEPSLFHMLQFKVCVAVLENSLVSCNTLHQVLVPILFPGRLLVCVHCSKLKSGDLDNLVMLRFSLS